MTLLWPLRTPNTLSLHEVDVWAWTFGSSERNIDEHSPVLSGEERQRMNRFYFLRHRIQFATSHANLRRILGAYLQRDAQSLRFSTGSFGKPTLEPDEHVARRISFNLTHTATAGLLAVGSGIEVGVDAETIRPIGPDVAEAHFSAHELSALNTLSGDAWLNAFYTIWTRKEALLKAEGVGLNLPLADFDVSVPPDADAALLAWRPTVAFSHAWKLRHLAPAAGVIGALALSETPSRVTLSSFESSDS
jgi:4'-phosphopantetheinyl transferase